MIDALFTVAVYVAFALAMLGGAIVLTALAISAWDRFSGDYVGYDETTEFTDWADWDWPIPDDVNDWQFPDREAA